MFLLERKVNKRETYELKVTQYVPMNYYPVTALIGIEDSDRSKPSLFVLNDRSQGGSSLKNGQVELMVHRRIQQDDWKGNCEHLDEQENGKPLEVRVRHFVSIGDREKVRKLQQRVDLWPLLALSNFEYQS
jgi:lysosomal alpha-mannosidase